MNKKTMKILITVLCFAMITSLSVSVFASSWINLTTNDNPPGKNTITGVGSNIVSILRVVGMVISIIIIMILGIKYMMGSAEEKAEYKKNFVPFIVGAILLFAASVFAKTIYEFASGIGSN